MTPARESRDDLLYQGELKCDEATSLVKEGDYSAALDVFGKAERLFTEANDQHWLNFLRHEKLQVLQRLDRFEEALELTRDIITGYQETMNKNGLTLVLIHQSDILLALGKKIDALSSLNLAKSLVETENLHDLKGYLNSNLALVHQSLEDWVTAIQALESALRTYHPESTPAEYAWCLYQMGLCHQKLFDYDAAERYLTTAYQTCSSVGNYEMQQDITETLREIFSATNQLKKLANLG